MTQIKICGLSRLTDIEVVNQLQPEYVGFVFAPGSKRYVSVEQAKILKAALRPEIKAVGVMVNAEYALIQELVKQDVIDVVQLHGQEDDSYIAKIRTITDKPLIQAFRIDTAADVERAVKSPADYILLDAGAGGTGTSFDWLLVANVQRPFFLAGGLGIDNVEHAIATLHPYAVDVSSGVESEQKVWNEDTGAYCNKKLKNPAKMCTFTNLVRGIK